MIFEIFVAILTPPLLYVLFTYLYHLWELRKYPAGPFPLPIIGNLHQLGKKPYESLAELSKIYGDVFGISFGMTRAVIVNTIEPTREALITKGVHFAGRPSNMYTAELVSRGYINIGFADYGAVWRMVRKFGHSSLKMYGENMKHLIETVSAENEDFHKRLKALNGKPTEVKYELGLSILNIISGMVFGDRYERDDPEFKQLIDFATDVFAGLGNSDAVSFLPWLRYFPLPGLKMLERAIKIRDALLKKKLLEHKKSFDGENVHNITDALLKVTADEKIIKECGQTFTDDHLEMILNDVFVGGYETTLTTVRWSVLYLIHWPQYQEKIYEEIIKISGTDRYPDLNDRSSLPFTHACINETLRLCSLAPLSVPHKAIQDSSIGGKAVPKDALVLFNIWNIHNNKKYWKDPETFDPTRWLDENGEFVVGRHISYLPFSAGRRVCLGESLAKLELFTFYTRMVRNFKIENVPDAPLPTLDGNIGITLSPKKFKVVFTPRENNLIQS